MALWCECERPDSKACTVLGNGYGITIALTLGTYRFERYLKSAIEAQHYRQIEFKA